jgi:hypothetical protein
MLNLPKDAIARLERLRAEQKFRASPDGFYTGVRDETDRESAGLVVNELIRSIEYGLPEHPTKQFVLSQFSIALSNLHLTDTEDREQATRYFEAIMDCVGLDSSDGLLNRWLYGPILGSLIQ